MGIIKVLFLSLCFLLHAVSANEQAVSLFLLRQCLLHIKNIKQYRP